MSDSTPDTTTPLAEARLDIHDFVTQTLTALSFDIDDDTSDEDILELEELMSTITSVLLDAMGLEVLSVDDEDGQSYTVKLTLLGDGPDDSSEEDGTSEAEEV